MNKTTETPAKKVSRRDAIKLLTAVAGATALANTPARWSKPELKVGVLPVHAQTSVVYTLACDPDAPIEDNVEQPPITITSKVTVAPGTANISMQYSIVLDQIPNMDSGAIDSPIPPTGTVNTNSSGVASIDITYSNVWFGATITVNWSFADKSYGTASCNQVFSTPAAPPA